MSFFGLTYLGSGNVFQNTRANKLERVMAIPEERFVRIFQAMSLEATRPSLAREIRRDGHVLMARAELPELMTRVLGDVPRREELDAFLTFFDITGSGTIDVGEFTEGVRRLLEPVERAGQSRRMLARASDPRDPAVHGSHARLTADRAKNRRPRDDPQSAYAKPLTASQELGWHARQARISALGVPRVYRPLAQTDVTLREGRSLASFYGEQ